MNIKEQMDTVLDIRKKLNINDDFGIEKCWNEMTEILGISEKETIDYLETINEQDLYYVSEIFEDISEKLQSLTFIDYLRKLDIKYPDLKMTNDIDITESYIKK